MSYRVVHLELDEANALIEQLHRHHKRVTGHRFSIGAERSGSIVGVAIAGRPVARKTNHRRILEVTRVATDGTKNANSFLYGACARAAAALGYGEIQTFTLPEESGASLIAAGWTCEGLHDRRPSHPWKRTDGSSRRQDQPNGPKLRWRRVLR